MISKAVKVQAILMKRRLKEFFDSLEPSIGLQVSLGQTNSPALCPVLTSHSELSSDALATASISPTTICISVGLEDPRRLIAHIRATAQKIVDPLFPGFSNGLIVGGELDALYRETYLDMHQRVIAAKSDFEMLAA